MKTATRVMRQTKEWRCTRQSSGTSDLTARQGHYIKADTETEARVKMAKMFPEDLQRGYGFDFQLWKESVPVWETVK